MFCRRRVLWRFCPHCRSRFRRMLTRQAVTVNAYGVAAGEVIRQFGQLRDAAERDLNDEQED